MDMERTLTPYIAKDLETKMVLLSGPRQVGKTTLSQALNMKLQYLNFDSEEHRKIILGKTWDRSLELIVFDELHKKPKWKSWIKGIYDTEPRPPSFLVTGSARMDIFKKGSDSLAGRHFNYRLHPLSLAELENIFPPHEALETLLTCGGFPEPFLNGTDGFAKRWRRTHIDRILKEDILEIEQIRQFKSLELLVDLLSERVGSPISYSSLARDLEVSPNTIKRWIEILEAFYVIFVVPPFSKNLARSILKEPKIFFYDNGKVRNDEASKLENLVALSLLKDINLREDIKGEKGQLFYLRDKEKREVDFLVTRENKIHSLVEVKLSDNSFSKNLFYFEERLKPKQCFQIVKNLKLPQSTPKIKMQGVVEFLLGLEILNN